MSTFSAKGLYEKLSSERTAYVQRARTCADLTIPSLFPPEGSKGEQLVIPHQGVGSRAVKCLTSKLFLTMLPPEIPFFRLKVDPVAVGDLAEETQGRVEQGLARLERLIIDALDARSIRPVIYEAIKHLIVTGNALLHIGADNIKMYQLDKYVVRRDPDGKPSDIIVCEDYRTADLTDELRESLSAEQRDKQNVKLYTWIRHEGDVWKSEQYVEEVKVPNSDSEYDEGRCPWLPLRMVHTSGEDYGRSYVEEHLGDLYSLETLSRSISNGAVAAAKIVFLVRPNGVTDVTALNKAPNGGFVPGNPEDIHCVQLDKHNDLAIAKAQSDEIRQGIAQAFLMNTAVQRKGERVTAEEIRTLTSELEQVLGGVYALLSAELQVPLVGVMIGRLEQEGAVPEFPKDTFKPSIVTGVDAMGRGQDFQRLMTLTSALQPFGEHAYRRVEMGELIKRLAAALSVEETGLIRPQEEIDKEDQQRQAMELMQRMGPEALKQKAQQQQGEMSG